ncbi:Scr1 family TA system antitoxin-like transcriptional regulator [Kitasatospora sp. NPDC091257]|uniref:helix-turn-helix domain-containing protein n=1 Tax=Kitasatospora sp. NPDC091257 TaxID=3364084 RepID=UPI00381B205F
MVNIKEIDPSSSPWAPFGIQLRNSRKAKGLLQHQLARKCGVSASYVSFVELAHRPPSEKFATKADEVLETGGTLMLMWWQHKHTALVPGFPEYANHENRAAEVRLFSIDIVSGLLQTHAYAGAWEAANIRRGTATPEQAEERVAFLMTRQQLLARTPTPLLHAVLDESCLRRPVGGTKVMIEQLQHLEQLAASPSVIIQVAPYSLGEERPFSSHVTLLTMPDRKLLGYGETEVRGYLDRDIDTVLPLFRGYDRLQIEALNQAASMETIRAVRKGYEDGC